MQAMLASRVLADMTDLTVIAVAVVTIAAVILRVWWRRSKDIEEP